MHHKRGHCQKLTSAEQKPSKHGHGTKQTGCMDKVTNEEVMEKANENRQILEVIQQYKNIL